LKYGNIETQRLRQSPATSGFVMQRHFWI